ncbi:hypothetical protein XELAEV_18016769mg [Xenopus laevis]|uniref:Uncharacterized protein n=1 Tax=Xenopus laevis TaxID=8355 RepID=A0A974DBY3_XENLA|nr:hypothetical protein XELAEV_18016769mg [Xenopus laevis]
MAAGPTASPRSQLTLSPHNSLDSPSEDSQDASQPGILQHMPTPPKYSGDTILIFKSKELLQRELNITAHKITSQLSLEIQELGQRTDLLESKVDDLINTSTSHHNLISSLTAQLTDLQDKVEDAENCSRRNNVRICGLLDDIKDLHLLVPNIPSERIELDRVHRAQGQRAEGSQPKDIIAQIHYFSTKEAIMAAARAANVLSYKGFDYQLYTDLSPAPTEKTA